MKPRRACTERSRSPTASRSLPLRYAQVQASNVVKGSSAGLERSEGIDFQKSTAICRNLNFDLRYKEDENE